MRIDTGPPAQRRSLDGTMVVSALVLVLAVVTACSSGGPMTREERRERPLDEQRAELMARPTNAEIRATYDRMLADVRARLGERLGLQPWVEDPGSVSRSGCSDFADGLGGASGSGATWYHRRSVSDTQWPELLRVVEQVLVGYGFQPLERVNEQPASQTAVTTDRYGATFEVGNGSAAASIDVYLGCHPVSR